MSNSGVTSVRRLNRNILPTFLKEASGRNMLRGVDEIVESDRWNSFDQFSRTTEKIVKNYEQSGAKVEVESIQTGGQVGSGRWVIREAADVQSAMVDIVSPVKERVLDYDKNPWHIIQWSAATSSDGIKAELVIVDDIASLNGFSHGSLRGKVVLTCMSPRPLLSTLADLGAVGVISDQLVPNLPDALAWTKFGWGSIPLSSSGSTLVGFVVSKNAGIRLREKQKRYGKIELLLRADIKQYVGHHDVVSGIIQGVDDEQDEVWAIAHSGEPGAADNASGVVVTLEIARLLESLIESGEIKRPRRSIRLVNAYECYGFFGYLEKVDRFQNPLAGVCIDTVGLKPALCGARLEWHSTIPMSAGFVDRVGEPILRSALYRHKPGYRFFQEPFVSTSDTLIGDPKYGFPCPWLTTFQKSPGVGFDAYHSSADVPEILSSKGLETCAASMAAYLYYLAEMGTNEVLELAKAEFVFHSKLLKQAKTDSKIEFILDGYLTSNKRLKRWLWGGDKRNTYGAISELELRLEKQKPLRQKSKNYRVPKAGKLVPRRVAILCPTTENLSAGFASRLSKTGLSSWALFWADGERNISQIARKIECEETASIGGLPKKNSEVDINDLINYFEIHSELGYVDLIDPLDMITKTELLRDLRALGVRAGMDLMVHSSLSALGVVKGGAETVVNALLEAVGRKGTLIMPSFNHRSAAIYNPLTTPTINGAIPDAMWRRENAFRSLHPTHPVAAIGAKAQYYCEEHVEVGIWAARSPIGKLVHGGGFILALGLSHETSTAYHVAEISVPCNCINSFGNKDRLVNISGDVVEVSGLAFRNGICPVPIAKMEKSMDRKGLQRRGYIGKGESQLVLAKDLWNVRRRQLKNICPTCNVKPNILSEVDKY